MGLRNLRAICPNCGAKIHTQPKGLGHFTWANSWFSVQTGTECPYCHIALTGKVTAGNRAVAAGAAGTGSGKSGKPTKVGKSGYALKAPTDIGRGWKADPALPSTCERWWDGARWTSKTRRIRA
jgi:DNA-directed RNA polymerase subunit RPC12/RpoP